MISFFLKNDPYRLIFGFLLLLLVSLPFFVHTPGITLKQLEWMGMGDKVAHGLIPYSDILTHIGIIPAYLYGFLSLIDPDASWHYAATSVVLIFIQAVSVNRFAIISRLFDTPNYLPTLVYVTLSPFFFDLYHLSPLLIGNTFFVLAMKNTLEHTVHRARQDAKISRIGLYLSLAGLCSPVFLLGIVLILFILMVFSATIPRRYLLLLLSVSLPYLTLFIVYLWTPNPGSFLSYFSSYPWFENASVQTQLPWILGILPGIFFLLSLWRIFSVGRFKNYQTALLQSLFITLIFILLMLLASQRVHAYAFCLLLPVISIYLALFFMLWRRRFWPELGYWILLLGTLFIGLSSNYVGWPASTYISAKGDNYLLADHPPPNYHQDALRLEFDPQIFLLNNTASGFLDPLLSYQLVEKAKKEERYQERLLQVLLLYPPAQIEDPKGHFQELMAVIPALSAYYESGGNQLYRLRKR